MPPESPVLYGLHPNAEIGFLTATSEKLFRTVFELQPRESGATGGPVTTREEKIKVCSVDHFEFGAEIVDQFALLSLWVFVKHNCVC